ncbi:TPA: beta-carotene 15,15'-monooxygenase, partial [Streptococcus pneumoniae]
MTKYINSCIKLLFIYSLFSELLYSYYSVSLLFTIPDLLLLAAAVIVFVDSYSAGKIRVKNPHISLMLFFILLIFLLISFTWGTLNIYGFVMRGRYILGAFLVYFMTNSYLDDRTFSSLINIAYFMQILNLLLVLHQNIVLHLHPDFTNGIFGFTNYANGIQGFYCLALSVLSTVYYLYGKWGTMKSLILIAISCIICALAEIK